SPTSISLAILKQKELDVIPNRTKVFDVITSISPQENNVVIIIQEEDKIKNRKFIDTIKPYGPKIEIIQKNKAISSQTEIGMSKDDPPIKYRLLGGDGLFNTFTKKICSVGFLAKAKNENKKYIVTAEHCRDRTKRQPSKFLQLAWNSTSAAGSTFIPHPGVEMPVAKSPTFVSL
ncbi:20193_t:CDS:2, partial [Gigaspora rosea]